MKHIITSIILLNCYLLHAQKTYVPDNNFEQALINLGYDNALDDSVLTANISGVTSLNVENNGISDMTGIEAFTSLTTLYCNYNNLTSIDISSNTALITLMLLYNNDLDSLDVSNNTALTTLRVGSDQLTSLDVSNNTALTDLYCWCELTTLDVSANTALTYLDVQDNYLDSLDVSNNTALTELRSNNNNLTSLDISNNTALIHLYCSHNNLTSLDISNNTALTGLSCSNNQLDSLDVSNNTALTYLGCGYNNLTSLDVSNNTLLTSLQCNTNQLTSLNVSNNTALTDLNCNQNDLESLDVSNNTALTRLKLGSQSQQISFDVSNNTALTFLNCSYNDLTSLDVSNNTALEWLWCNNNNLDSLDVSNNTALEWLWCNNNNLDSLDISNNTALTDLRCGQNNLSSLDVSNHTALTSLGCSYNELTVLDVSNNTALTNLNCSGNGYASGNALTALDVSNNTALLWLYCGWNGLTAVDVSNNTALRLLTFRNNDLTSLDVSSNTALTSLNCHGNELTYLNMSNGITDALTTFDATDNTSLTCIETLDPGYATTNWTSANGNIDEGVTFAVDCTPEPPTLDPPTLVINEILAYNYTCCTDANGDYDSYLELYNYGDEEVDIGGMVITDDLNNYDHYYQIPTTPQTVLANYPLATDVADQMGNFGDLTLYGNPTAPSVPSAGSPLYSNGIYAMDTLGQDISTPSITTLDNTNFQVDIEFNLASHGTGPSNPIIIGGGGYRWIGIINQSDGTVGVLYNNSNTVWSTTMLDTATWYSATLNYELGHVQLFIDGILAIDSTIASPLNHNYNNNFTTNNYSNGTALHGYMRNLRITNSTVANDSTTIQPGGFLLLWTDKESEQGVLHLEIELLSRGGEVGLFMSDSTTVVDTLTFVAQSADTAYGRYPDNSATWQLMDPTPGATNAGGLSLNDNIVIPSQYTLHQNYPNPFNPVTTLRYELPEQATVNITIYNMLGREVKTLINQTQNAGYKSVIWDATDDYGKPVSAGIYLYQIQAVGFIQTKKMVLLK